MIALSDQELERYSRHLLLPEVAMDGQARLKNSAVLVCGAGGLGAPVLLYLAAAGVGTIGVVDFDVVERSNLQRQIIYADADVGASKAECAATRLQRLNPEITVRQHELRLSQDNVANLVSQYDVIVDGTDNFATRYLVSDAAALAKKPYIYGSIYRFEGQASVFYPPHGPCYRCLFPSAPAPGAVPGCAEGGVLGVLAGTIGSIQATECIKILLAAGQSLVGRLLLYDALSMRFDVLKVNRNPACALCGDLPVITRALEEVMPCAPADKELACAEFEQLRHNLNSAILVDVRSEAEFLLGHIGGALHIPLGELDAKIDQLSSDQTILVYCRSGQRSGSAVEMLRRKGFSSSFSLRGGLLARQRETGEQFGL